MAKVPFRRDVAFDCADAIADVLADYPQPAGEILETAAGHLVVAEELAKGFGLTLADLVNLVGPKAPNLSKVEIKDKYKGRFEC